MGNDQTNCQKVCDVPQKCKSICHSEPEKETPSKKLTPIIFENDENGHIPKST